MVEDGIKYNKYVTVNPGNKSYLMNEKLVSNLNNAKRLLDHDYDLVFVVDGKEGFGKSTFVQQAAYYMSNGNFNINNICFDGEQFLKRVRTANKGDHIVLDEGFKGLSSRGTMSEINKRVVSVIQQMRQLNCVVWICIPSIWDLDSYIAKHRMVGLFHCYTAPYDKTDKGYFKYFPDSVMTYFLANSKRRYTYPPFKQAPFFGKWSKGSPMDDYDLYKEKKLQALKESTAYEQVLTNDKKGQVDSLLYILHHRVGWNFMQIEREFNTFCPFAIKRTQIRERIAEFSKHVGVVAAAGGDRYISNSPKEENIPPIPNGATNIEGDDLIE